jgi:hypothetical protein
VARYFKNRPVAGIWRNVTPVATPAFRDHVTSTPPSRPSSRTTNLLQITLISLCSLLILPWVNVEKYSPLHLRSWNTLARSQTLGLLCAFRHLQITRCAAAAAQHPSSFGTDLMIPGARPSAERRGSLIWILPSARVTRNIIKMHLYPVPLSSTVAVMCPAS